MVYIILPFIKIIMFLGCILYFIEMAIRFFIFFPILFIFTTMDMDKFCENSIIADIGENWFNPLCEKLGIEIERR